MIWYYPQKQLVFRAKWSYFFKAFFLPIAILGDVVMIEEPVVSATLKVESLWVGGLIRDLRILRLEKNIHRIFLISKYSM